MPVILATQEAEIRRILVQSQPRQIVLETLASMKCLVQAPVPPKKEKKTSKMKVNALNLVIE
jgi:hypothetical protein